MSTESATAWTEPRTIDEAEARRADAIGKVARIEEQLADEAIARQMLFTLVDAAMGSFSLSSGGAVWVRDREVMGHA